MPELGFQDCNVQLTITGVGETGDMSPDSVIYSANSNFSTFFSVSEYHFLVESDVQDHSSLASGISQHLAVHECHETCSNGIDPNRPTVDTNNLLYRQVEIITVQDENSEVEAEKKNQVLDSARSSFSQALKDCQVRRRSRSEALLKKPDKRRPASLDLNNAMANATNSSQHYNGTKKSFVSAQRTCLLTPETPSYRHQNVSIQKGWSSERVALPTSANRKNANYVSFPSSNGRKLPSKWEDAERWIFSPISGDGARRTSFPPPYRRPRSKSGPLGPGTKYSSMYSPAMHMSDGCNDENLMVANPLTSGEITTDSLSIQCGERHEGNVRYHAFMEPCMGRSISIHGCSETLCQSVLPSFHGGKLESVEVEDTGRSHSVSKRDMATQVSSEGSLYSPSMGKSSCSPQYSSVLPIMEYQSFHPSPQEIRDVQIDGRVTMTRPRKHIVRNQGKALGDVDDWKKRALEITSARWEVSNTAKSISKIKREEARIIAWENLQNAKAEAAIQKLEMKLEKKRSSSIDKIMNKLRSSQRKAQEMRSSMSVYQAHQVAKPSNKVISFRKTSQIGSLSGCFTCHAF